MAVEWTMAPGQMLVPALHGVDAVCSYFIVGGLVFAPVSFPFLEQFYGSMVLDGGGFMKACL